MKLGGAVPKLNDSSSYFTDWSVNEGSGKHPAESVFMPYAINQMDFDDSRQSKIYEKLSKISNIYVTL